MAKLRRPFSYATSGNYPGVIGTTAWSGLARRYSPTDAELADGDTPDTPIGVEKANYFVSLQGDALTVQSHAALANWGQFLYAPAASLLPQFIIPVPAGSTIAAPNLRPRTFVLSGSNSGNQVAKASQDLKSFEIAAGVGAFGPYVAVASDDSGVLFGGIASGAYKSSANGGQTYATFTPGVAVVHAVYYTGTHYIVMAAAGGVTAATALAGAWSTPTFLPTTGTVRQLVGNRRNGSTATAIVALVFDSVFSHYIAYMSSTNGNSWTLGQDFGTPASNITYSEAWGLFVVVNANGELWTSSDGVAWTKQKTASPLVGVPLTGFAKSAAVGDAIAVIVNRLSGFSFDNNIGIAYTFDLGATWYETYFGDMTATSVLRTIVAANGRLYACDDTKIYISGALESPASPVYLGV